MIQNASSLVDSSSGEVIMGDLEVLEEDLDSNYEPTQQEIEEYAQYLGMDPVEDEHLLWIAEMVCVFVPMSVQSVYLCGYVHASSVHALVSC